MGKLKPAKFFLINLLISVGLSQAAIYLVRPMMSYQILEQGLGVDALGLVAAAYALVPLVIALPLGRWLDHHSSKAAMVAGAAIVSASSVLLVLIPGPLTIVLASAVVGTGHLASVVAAQTMLARRGPLADLEKRFGQFTVSASLGQLLGPLAGGMMVAVPASTQAEGTSRAIVFASMLALAACGFAVAIRPVKDQLRPHVQNSTAAKRQAGSVRRVLGTGGVPQAIVVGLALLVTVDLIVVFLPALGDNRGISVEVVSLLLATRAGFTLLSRLSLGWMLARFSRTHILTVSLALAALSTAALPLVSGNPVLLFIDIAVAGFTLGVGQPLTMAWIAGIVPSNLTGTAMGVRMGGNRAGQVTIPLVAGLGAASAGPSPVFFFMGVLLAGAAFFARMPEPGAERKPEEPTPEL